MIGLIGRKVGMSQVFDEEGVLTAVSVIEAGPCPVVQVKTSETDGYDAIQVAFGPIRHTRADLPTLGHFRKAGLPPYRHVQEFRVDNAGEYKQGQLIDVGIFKDAGTVDVTGRTKGRGFQGVVKRHKFSGGDDTHGSKCHRVPGSIGSSAYPSRVWKGRKLPGHMGDVNQHVKNLKVVEVDVENNILLVRGAVPGAANTILRLTPSPKKKA